MNKNDIIKLQITAVSSEGSGIGRYEDKAVFVPTAKRLKDVKIHE